MVIQAVDVEARRKHHLALPSSDRYVRQHRQHDRPAGRRPQFAQAIQVFIFNARTSCSITPCTVRPSSRGMSDSALV
jgi:hypothetical protein